MSRIGLPTTLIVALTLVFGISNFASAADQSPVKTPDVVYVGTPHDVVAKMLELAKVTKADLVYDLGCGDGRIVVTAAKKYGCRGVGFDINPVRVREAEENLRRNGVEKLVTIRPQDIFTVDLRQVTVVTLYLLPRLNVRLIPQLKKLPPGSRIVSHDFDMQGVKPDRVITMLSKEDAVEHTLYLWTTPLKLDDNDAESEEKEEEEEK